MKHTPLQLRMALAYYSSPHPEDLFAPPMWSSDAAQETREWLLLSGLVDRLDFPHPTDKLRAFVDALCSVPLPVQQWIIPKEADNG